MKISFTTPQLEVIKGASRNEVTRGAGADALDLGWRIGGEFGRPVTNTVEALMRRGLVRESTELVDGRRPLVVTADGYEQLSEASHRAR